MNRLKVKKEKIYRSDYQHMTLYIDDIRIDKLISDLSGDDSVYKLLFAWPGLEMKHESNYIKGLIDDRVNCNLPILVCPDDVDLSCYLVVVKVEYNVDKVIWSKIGKRISWVHPKGYLSEFDAGIRDFENWPNEFWELYGEVLDTFNLEDKSWNQWITNNWDIESEMRMKNYYHPVLNNDANFEWYKEVPIFKFDIQEYNKCIEEVMKEYTRAKAE